MKLIITGGAGFIGTNYVYHAVEAHKDYEIVVIDKVTYSGNRSSLAPLGSRVQFVEAHICDAARVSDAIDGADFVVHFAAESHVTRSEIDPDLFCLTNVLGTQTLLDAAHRERIKRFVRISTDEVYGPVPEGVFVRRPTGLRGILRLRARTRRAKLSQTISCKPIEIACP